MRRSPMENPTRRFAWLVVSTLATVILAAGASEDWEQLRKIPRERRVQLDAKLREFDGLDSGQQAAIRALDAAVAALPDDDRATQYGVMRRYQLWYQTLTEAQRNELIAAPVSKRLKVVDKLRAEQRAASPSSPMLFQIGDFGSSSPYDLASRIKVWLKLSAAEKADVSKLPEADRGRRMNELAKSYKIAPVAEPAISDEQMKQILERAVKSAPLLDALLKRGDEEKKKAVRQRRFLEAFYLLENPPEKVKSDNLLRFDAALPPWIRPTFDTLSGEEARRSLSILYRLVFPAPLEIESSQPVAKTPASAPAKAPPSGSKKAATPPAPGKGPAPKATGPY